MTENRSIEKQKKAILTFSVIAMAIGFLLRIANIGNISLEYDEIWTFTHYVPGECLKIFTDLATPNNHPLHSLLAKISVGIFGNELWALRLPALLAGCGLIPLLWYTMHKIKPSPEAGVIAIVWGAFHGYSLYYSQAARGYSLQMFFVLATFLGMWLLYKNPQSKKTTLLLVCSAICCCLTITSGLIYVCALAGAFTLCFLLQKEENKVQLLRKKYILFPVAGLCFILFAALWYGLNFKTIQQGQQFGTTLNSFSVFCKFVHQTFKDIFLYPLLAITIAGTCIKNQYRRFAVFALLFTGLILLSAFATKAGPPRVYLGLYPILTVTAALTLSALIDEYCKKPQIRIVLYLLCVLPPALTWQKEWTRVTPPDWGRIAAQVRQDVSKDILTVYTPPDSYPVRYNDTETVLDQLMRIKQCNINGIFLINAQKPVGSHHLTFANTLFAEKLDIPSQKIKMDNRKVTGYFYPLEPVTIHSKTYRQPLLLVIRNTPETTFQYLFNTLKEEKDKNWLLLNLWLKENQRDTVNNITYINRIYGLNEAQYDAEHYLDITRRSGGLFRFYQFKN